MIFFTFSPFLSRKINLRKAASKRNHVRVLPIYALGPIAMKPEEEQKLKRLLEVDAALQNEQPNRKADALRNLIFESRFAALSKDNGDVECEEPYAAAFFQEQYEKIVDCDDPNKGLKNFTAGALALCANNRNERDKWTSSLDKNTITSLPCVKNFIKRCQLQSKRMFPCADVLMQPQSTDAAINFRKPLFTPSTSQPGQSLFKAATIHSDHINESGLTAATKPGPSWNVSGSARPQAVPSRPTAAFSAIGKAGKRGFSDVPFGADEDGDDGDTDDSGRNAPRSEFKTAKEQFVIDQRKKNGQDRSHSNFSYGSNKKSLGTRRGPNNRFIPPVLHRESDRDVGSSYSTSRAGPSGGKSNEPEEPVDERLKGIEPKIVELITNEIMDHRPQMDWEDIAGLQFAKNTIKEIVVWPMLRPDIFTGLRGPPKGLLLFGPPGTGKTLIGKCIASQSKSTFFCISASSLTSKWVGEGEKMVRALFAVARCHQPAVIFIDEVDSLLSQRSDGEHEASRRIKTEFLVQLDGATTESEDRILVIGATNRPQEIDEAARRRFVKRLYIPLPELSAREHIVRRLMSTQHCQLNDADITAVAKRTEGYSGADMANLCREAALGPIRSIPFEQMEYIRPEQVPPITRKDFELALPQVRPSVSEKDLDIYITWNNTYGSFGQGAGV